MKSLSTKMLILVTIGTLLVLAGQTYAESYKFQILRFPARVVCDVYETSNCAGKSKRQIIQANKCEHNFLGTYYYITQSHDGQIQVFDKCKNDKCSSCSTSEKYGNGFCVDTPTTIPRYCKM
eukprot:Nk52_evm15s271 gene=Nk52_evmTU15s271